MSCSYIKKQLRRNSLQLQSFDAFCRLNGLRRQHKGNKVIFALLSNFYGLSLLTRCCRLIFLFWTQLTEEDKTILKIITYVGLSLSIVGILLTLILYYCLTYVMYLNIDDVDSHLPSTRLERKEISMQISMPIRKYMSAE